jgi:hypothetical protein
MVLLALAVQEVTDNAEVAGQSRDLGSCPSAEELAALGEGLVSGEKRKSLLTHMNVCPDCYREWLVVGTNK